jgi:hypothetical protein
MATFIQTIEFRTSRFEDGEALVDRWMEETAGKRTATRSTTTQDRDRPGTYLTIVEFASYEDAMRNSELPETQALAEALAKLADGPPQFRNLDVVRENLSG